MEDILMSTQEAERLRLVKNHADGMITLRKISSLLGLSYRQTLRTWHNFNLQGAIGLVSKKRKNQNRALSSELERTVVALIKQNYHDYGPTLITEKLKKNHQITISKESIRKILIKNGLREVKRQKTIKIYQRRKRRSCFGELEQLDGSPHEWLESRGPICTLHLAVDDATGKITAGRFEDEETTEGYFHLMKTYIQSHGKPLCLYTDKYSSFRVNHGEDRSKPTQCSRAMKELGIKMVAAHSPQAKGRIERTNGILQDRLVKELREKDISTIEEANLYLPTFIEEYNKRFGKVPASPFNAHHGLEHNQNLDEILCNKETRRISKNLEIRYKNKIYQIQAFNRVNRLRGAGVQVVEKMDGSILIDYKGEFLDFIVYEEFSEQAKIVDHKTLSSYLEQVLKKHHKPSKHHPWRSSGKSVNF